VEKINLLNLKKVWIKIYQNDWLERVTEKVTEKVTENQRKIINIMFENPNITVMELKEIICISRKSILENISKLKNKNILERIGPDKGGYWKIIKKL